MTGAQANVTGLTAPRRLLAQLMLYAKNPGTLLSDIKSCLLTGKDFIVEVRDFCREHPSLVFGVGALSLICGGITYVVTACSLGQVVKITCTTGVVVGCFSYAALSEALEVLEKERRNHQNERRYWERRHQTEKAEWEAQFSRMEEKHKNEKKDWEEKHKNEKKDWEEKHENEKKDWEARFSRMEEIHQQQKKEWKENQQKEKERWEARFSRMEENHQQEKREWKEEVNKLKTMMQQILVNQQQNGNAQ